MFLYLIISTSNTITDGFLGLYEVIHILVYCVLTEQINAVYRVLLSVAMRSILSLHTIGRSPRELNE